MGAAEHRIGRVRFAVTGTDEAALLAAGAAMQARFDAILAPALEAALDGIDRAGTLLRLDRIEVDLGQLSEAVWSGSDLRVRIAAALARALPADRSVGGPPLDRFDDGPPPDIPADGPGAAADLANFLATGQLPWVEPGRALAQLAEMALGLDGPGMARLAAWLRMVLIRRQAAERAVRQLPRALVRRLLRALLPDALAGPLARAFGPDGVLPMQDGAEFSYLAGPQVGSVTELLLRLARASVPEPELGEVFAVYAALLGAAAPPPVLRPVVPAPASPVETGPLPSADTMAGERGADSDTAMPVHAAGVVILAPFLGPFLAACGLLDAAGQFVDAGAQARAVLLTHYLATGAEAAAEPETTLCKLLCGMDFSTPLPRAVGFSARERDEARRLLETVIGHWDRLGATTPDGLREAFLRRPGRLERRSGPAPGWRLRLEPSGVDVLLAFLPWPIGLIRTAFMRDPLHVDWR